MADEQSKELLLKWQLSPLTAEFERQGIDFDCLRFMDAEHIKSLKLTLGVEIKLLHHLKRWQKEIDLKQNKENSLSTATNHTKQSPAKRPLSVEPEWFQSKHQREPDVEEPLVKKSQFTLAFSVAELLESDIYSRGIMHVYSREASLSDHYRQVITNQIAKRLFESYGTKIPMAALLEARCQVLALFPSEKKETWYDPPCRGREQLESIGCLYYRVKHLRSELHAMGVLEPLKRYPISPSQDVAPISSEVLEKLAILQKEDLSDIPDQEILDLWSATSEQRYGNLQLLVSYQGVIDFFPVLKNIDLTIALINFDFNKVYSDASKEAALKWEATAAKILQKIQKCKTGKFKDFSNRVQVPELSNNVKQALALWILAQKWHHSVTSKKSTKLSGVELSNSIICTLPTKESIAGKIKSLKRLENLHHRPFIACIGTDFENTDEILVVLDSNFVVPVKSTFEGLELAFKSQAVYKHIAFDDCVSYIWNVIEKIVFGSKYFKKDSSKVSKIVTDLN